MEPENWTALDEFAKAAMKAALGNTQLRTELFQLAKEKSLDRGRSLATVAYEQADAMMAEKARREAKEVET